MPASCNFLEFISCFTGRRRTGGGVWITEELSVDDDASVRGGGDPIDEKALSTSEALSSSSMAAFPLRESQREMKLLLRAEFFMVVPA